MTTAAMSVTHPGTAPGLERATVALLLCFVASLQISIAAANILLALMMVVWTVQMVQDKTLPAVPRFFWPLAAYAAVTLVISAFSLTELATILPSLASPRSVQRTLQDSAHDRTPRGCEVC